MGQTFYNILGVSTDADQETIRRAYREQVKDAHPDVSDSPDASRRFKRLTTARDVLVDDDERRQYDRLGHDTYVSRHVETSVWQPTEPPESSTASQSTENSTGTTSTSTGQTDRTTGRTNHSRSQSAGQTNRSTTQTDRQANRSTRQTRTQSGKASQGARQGATPDGGYGANWQQAPDAYMRSTIYGESTTPGQTLGEILRQLGPWLVVHAVLLTSAVGTGTFIVARASADPHISLSAALFMILLLGLVIVLSVFHLLTVIYT